MRQRGIGLLKDSKGRKILSSSGSGITSGVRIQRKCKNLPKWMKQSGMKCQYFGVYKGKRYRITSDAMMELGLLKGMKVKVGKKWLKFGEGR